MTSGKTKLQRRVAPYDEGPMRKFNIRLTSEQISRLTAIGDGNFSLGVRRALERAEEVRSTMTEEEWEESIKRNRAKNEKTKKLKENISQNPIGRPALKDELIKKAQYMYFKEGKTIKEISSALKIHLSTIYRYVDVRKKI